MMFIFVFTIICLCLCATETQTIYPCSLTWVETSRGMTFPTPSVNVDGQTQFVASARIPGRSSSSIGRVDVESGNGFFPFSSTQYNLTSYEILTNTFDCILAWLPPNHEYSLKYSVKKNGQKIGRALLPEKDYMASGYLDQFNVLHVADGGQVLQFNPNELSVLTSISRGIEMKITKFTFHKTPATTSTEMIGKDEIINDSAATAFQKVSHGKNVTEFVRLNTEFQMNVAQSAAIDVCFLHSCKIFSVLQISQGFSLHVTETNEFSFIRTIEVPPYTSVEVCSIIEKVDNFESTWDANVEFKCAGKSGEEVLQLVKNNPGWTNKEFVILGNTVTARVEGSVSANFFMSSKFNAGEIGGNSCS